MATEVGVPGRVVEDIHKPFTDLEHEKLPDPVAEVVRVIFENQGKLAALLGRIERLYRINTNGDESKETVEVANISSRGSRI